jgi:hypothetical protein
MNKGRGTEIPRDAFSYLHEGNQMIEVLLVATEVLDER